MSSPSEETLAIIKRIGPVVLSAAGDVSGNAGSALHRCVGMMLADYNMSHIQTFCVAFGYILDLARSCGASLVTLDRVRKAALTETPKSLNAVQTVLAIIRLTLACEARIVAGMTFKSRDEVEAIAEVLNAAFGQSEEMASDDLDANIYIALITLHGDLTKHLADRGRLLPRVIEYKYQVTMTALRMAQRAYTDPSRYLELITENDVVHPAFMPMSGTMLAV